MMEISIKEVKKLIDEDCKINEKTNELNNYVYISKNYKKISITTQNIAIKCYLCLHRRNYKTILIDQTDWIYCKFLDSSFQSKQTNSINLNSIHLLNEFKIKNFNVFIEKFYLHSKNNKDKNGYEKTILYLQTDISLCDLKKMNQNELNHIESKLLNDECRKSFLITKELLKIFRPENLEFKDKQMIDDTLEEDSINLDLKYDSNFYYLFKITNIGQINSLANSQFKTKLRADFKIDIIPIIPNEKYKPATILLSLMSKFLFYYNFLHIGKLYTLISSKKLSNINFEKYDSKSSNRNNLNIFFLDDFCKIIDDFKLPNLFQNTLNETSIIEDLKSNQETEYLNFISGILIDKRLKTNNNMLDIDLNETLMNNFDLMIPNKEFKLVLKINDSNDYLTIYYDTRFSLYPLCILPGMNIEVYNLVKKSDRIYKSNSLIRPSYTQPFDLLNITNNPTSCLQNARNSDEKKKKKSLHENLLELSTIYDYFYNKKNQSCFSSKILDKDLIFNLLFKNDNLDLNSNFMKIYAQIIRIYELNLRIKCKFCNFLISSCLCDSGYKRNFKDKKSFYIEFSSLMLVDDHTSLLKLSFFDQDHDLKSNQSNFFHSISNYLQQILYKFLNEIKMPNIPAQINIDNSHFNNFDQNTKIYSAIRDKLTNEINFVSNKSNSTINNSIVNTDLNSNDSSYLFDNYAKLDIYKTLYDFVYNTVLDKHFLFYIDLNDFENTKELNKLTNGFLNNNKNLKCKKNFNYFKFSEMNSNEQFKSILNLKATMFCPVDVEFGDS